MHLAPGVEPGQQALHQGLKVGALAQGGHLVRTSAEGGDLGGNGRHH